MTKYYKLHYVRHDLNEHDIACGIPESFIEDAIEEALQGYAWVVDPNDFCYKAYKRKKTENGWDNVLFAECWSEEEKG